MHFANDRVKERSSEPATKAARKYKIGLLLAVLLNVFTVPLMLGRLSILNDARDSANWPTVTASVERFEALTAACKLEAVGSYRPYMCKYILQYDYQVEGRNHQSERVSFIGKPLFSEAKQWFQSGHQIMISYDPEDHGNATALHGDEYFHGGHLVVISELVVGLLGLATLIWTFIGMFFSSYDAKAAQNAR